MTIARRMGPKGSPIWLSMLDAAERILCEEGYGALTSRNVAERIGVKQRLVYYYFQTMDDLIVETFRGLAIRELERLSAALTSDHPLREIRSVLFHTADTRLISEFIALANRNEALRAEVRSHIEECRRLQVSALTSAMQNEGARAALPPVAAAIFAASAVLAIHREAEIGVNTGHAEILGVIDRFIADLGS